MVTCTNCQGTNSDDATTCIYCGQTLNQTFKKRGWWRRVLDALIGDPSGKHFAAGHQLVAQGRLGEAITEFNEVIRIDPKDAAAYYSRGLVYSEMGQYEKALEDSSEAIRLDPQLPEAYDARGLIYSQMGQYERALEDFGEAIRYNVSEMRQYQEASEDFSEVIQSIRDVQYDNYLNRSLAFDSLGRYEEALEDVNEAIRRDFHRSEGFRNRALTYTSLSMDTQAEKDVGRVQQLGEDISELRHEMEERKGQRPDAST